MFISPSASGSGWFTPRSSPTQTIPATPRVSQHAFKVVIGNMLAFALIATIGRTYARFSSFRRVRVDDVFFYIAAVFLIAGTGILYKSCEPMYLLQDIDTPPSDILPAALLIEKLEDAHVALLAGTIFSVKFSFLFFFRHLIWQNKGLRIWWWITLAVCIPSAVFIMFSTFIACHTFDKHILVNCTGTSAISHQDATFEASCILDAVTDAFLISIPIILLWNARLSIRRKFALCGVLCLSILMIIIAIVRVASGKDQNGQVDSTWANIWLQVEASVGVIVVSVSAFRALFVARKTSRYDRKLTREENMRSLKYYRGPQALPLWPAKWTRLGTSGKRTSANADLETPDVLSPVDGVDTHIRRGSSAMSFDDNADGIHLPLQVHVRKDISRFEDHMNPITLRAFGKEQLVDR